MFVPVIVMGILVAVMCRPPRRSGAARTTVRGRARDWLAFDTTERSTPVYVRANENPDAKSANAISTMHFVAIRIANGGDDSVS